MLKLALVSLFCVTLLCAGVSAQKKCKSVVKTAKSAKLNLLLELVTAAGLGDLLDDVEGDFTIFAPTDKAIEDALKALKVSKKEFVANKDLLAEILMYHVLPTAYTAEELAGFGEEGLPTLLGYDSSCSTSDLGFKFTKKAATVLGGESSANVVAADVKACSTIVHVIDAVLVPCPIKDASDTKEIASKKKLAEGGDDDEDEVEDEDEDEDEDEVEDDDEADGKKVKKTAKSTKITETKAKSKSSKTVEVEADEDVDEDDEDVEYDIDYDIDEDDEDLDEDLDEDVDEEDAEEEDEEEDDGGKKTVRGGLRCVPVLSQLVPKSKTLVKALTTAGLSKAINDEDAGLTLFAPTDKAFENALEALGITKKQLLRDRKLLKEILQFHVLRTSITAKGFKKGGTYTTLLGKNSSCKNSSVDIKVTKKTVTVDGGVNSATVVEADVEACSSTIHFIDTVLLPCEIDLSVDEED